MIANASIYAVYRKYNYRTGSVIFSAALHKGDSAGPRSIRQAILRPSPTLMSRQCSARSRRQARPITAVITTGALGVPAGAGGGVPGEAGRASPSAASEVLQSGVSLPGLRCRQSMASAPPEGTPRQLLANSR